jgi:4-hydroxybenzoate polyprenyltransferase
MISFFRLIRAPNVITSISNVCAGAFIGTSLQETTPDFWPLLILMTCSALIYANGIIWNDILDLEIDKKLRPKRPLPSGAIKVSTAIYISLVLGVLTIFLSSLISGTAVLLCLATMISAFLYDSWWKHNDWTGSIAMGLCRGLNLSIGFCVFASFSFHSEDPHMPEILFFSVFHFIYIFAITYIGTMQEGKAPTNKIFISLGLALLIISFVFFMPEKLYFTAKFILILILIGGIYRIILIYRYRNPRDIGLTVKYGILSMIPIDAIFTTTGAVGFWGFLPAILMLLLFYTTSFGLAKAIEMT